mgnify:CR=1 FL=1
MPRSGAPPRTRTTEDLSREPPTRAWGCSPELGGPSERAGCPPLRYRYRSGAPRVIRSKLLPGAPPGRTEVTWGAPREDVRWKDTAWGAPQEDFNETNAYVFYYFCSPTSSYFRQRRFGEHNQDSDMD